MKIIRSTKCSLKFATTQKAKVLQSVLKEYGKVVNIFIDYFWKNTSKVSKINLLKPVVDIPETWLSARLRKVAAREALDMIFSVKEVFTFNKEQLNLSIQSIQSKINYLKKESDTRHNRRKINNLYRKLKNIKNKYSMMQPHKPKHSGKRMSVSCTIADLQNATHSKFDSWLHLSSIGSKIILDLPIKLHKHFNELNTLGKRLNSYIITKEYVQFCFEIEIDKKKDVNSLLGIDTGINALASLSTGEQLGKDIKSCINRVKRCKVGGKGRKRAVNALKQRISEVAKETVKKADLIVVEKLKNMNNNSKLKGRLSKNIRSSIGNWQYRFWLDRLEQQCERNRVSFRSVLPYYTSQTCPRCGHTDRMNRSGEMFRCQKCDYSGNADVFAARNVLERFITGKYGSCYKHLITNFL
jgi:IS605 OrfB family transposase